MISLAIPRVHLVGGVVVALTMLMSFRLGYLQIYDRDFLQDQGDARTVRMERINAHRGIIQDRMGKPLAVSTPLLSLWAHPGELLAAENDFADLARYLSVDETEFRDRIVRASKKNFLYLRRHLTPSEARLVLDLKIPGIYSEREYHRFYPAGEAASHLIGFTNVDDKGQEGLELAFDRWLAGEPGKKKVVKNLYGEIIRDVKPVKEAVPGKNLTLSIDLRMQHLAYLELKSAVSHYKAQSGTVVVLDVTTGEVLALVNQPSYNPNNRVGLELSAVRNRAMTDVFEPGSTVKPFTVAVALQSGRFTTESVIDTNPGFVRVGNFTIRDPSNRGVISLGEIIAQSSQVGISKLALQLNEYDVWSMFDKLGFGRVTGAGFPGESAGYLPNHRRWKDIERATFAYGYGLTVTPVQLASAYVAIANGGVKRDVGLLLNTEVTSTRIMPEELANKLKYILAEVVRTGTGKKAAVDGFSVAGKTGTVRKIGENGYKDTEHIAFFAGMTPVEKPRLVGVVLINEPRTKEFGGGAIAAPVFSRVMTGALRILNVAPAVTTDSGAA